MKKSKVFLVFLLAIAILCNVAAIPVKAAEIRQDGLQVTLTTDKEEYEAGEQVLLSISVKNTNQQEVTNVTLVDVVSEKYELDETYIDSLKAIGTLAAGEEVSFVVKAQVKENAGDLPLAETQAGDAGINVSKESDAAVDEAHEPEDATAVEGVSVDDEPVAKEDAPIVDDADKHDNNQTGSDIPTDIATGTSPKEKSGKGIVVGIIIGIAVLACIGVIVAVRYKKGKELLSLVLCVAMAGSACAGMTVSVSAQEEIMHDGYTLMWSDEFEGTELDRSSWNVETHAPGWVNQELQEYVDSTENIYLEDGKLVIKAIKTGENSYTSGRINTQGKVDYTYGRFEARIQIPEGQGLWPAFWMMPTDESFYGQWPKCGEIDIMEILGHETNKSYGTIHFGEPHRERQGTYSLLNGNFADDFHVFAVEWEPGEIRYYVDDCLFYTANDWFTKREGFDEVAYPAPFDQPFYMILNLAVGGSMPGNPDATTVFDENTKLLVDYVRVYQKDEYDENVTKPGTALKTPDVAGNFVTNGDFSVQEDLEKATDWQFLLAEGGVGNASYVASVTPGYTTYKEKKLTVAKTVICAGEETTFEAVFSYLHTEKVSGTSDTRLKISSTACGTQNHSVQLVQANIPMERGWKYEFSFDAYADANRTMIADISAPDEGWIRYFPDTTVSLTTSPQRFSYTFDMTGETDANGRVEFNLGKQGYTDAVYIDNVVVKKISQIEIAEEAKSILPDGNYVYNGAFESGEGRLAYWEVVNNAGAVCNVTNSGNVREFKAIVPESVADRNAVVLKQSDMALVDGKEYLLSFDAYADRDVFIQTTVAGQNTDVTLTTEKNAYKYRFTAGGENSLVFLLGTPGTICIDNVRIQDDGMIVNGDFSNGMVGYEPFVDASANASITVDELTYGGACVVGIANTGDADWKIQLKQIVTLEEGKTYQLSFDAKSTMDRSIMYAIQRDGTIHKNTDGSENWTPYSDTKVIPLTGEYQNFSQTFTMTAATDENAILSISMGAVNNTQITDAHDVIIDNIVLVEVESEEDDTNGDFGSDNDNGNDDGNEATTGTEILANPSFANNGEGWTLFVHQDASTAAAAEASYAGDKATVQITNPGTADWNVKLIQNNVTLEKGATYKVCFHVNSDVTRFVSYGLQSGATWYQGGDWKYVGAGNTTVVEETFTVNADGSNQVEFGISLGKFDEATPLISNVEISNISILKISNSNDNADDVEGNLVSNGDFSNGTAGWDAKILEAGAGTAAVEEGTMVFDIDSVGTQNYHVCLEQSGLTLEEGATYRVSFEIESDTIRNFKYDFLDPVNGYAWYGGETVSLAAGEKKTVNYIMIIPAERVTSSTVMLQVSLGKIDETIPEAAVIKIDNVSVIKQ